jgi:hypothetical protein
MREISKLIWLIGLVESNNSIVHITNEELGFEFLTPIVLLPFLLLLFLLLPLGDYGIRETLVSLLFRNVRQSVGLLGLGISPSQGRYLTQTQNERKQTSMR